MPTICNRWFLLQILLLARHVSGTIMPIIRSSRVLYRWLLPVLFGALVFNHLYNTLELLMMGIIVPETCRASNKICNKNHLLHLVGILFPHIFTLFRRITHRIDILIRDQSQTAVVSLIHTQTRDDVRDYFYLISSSPPAIVGLYRSLNFLLLDQPLNRPIRMHTVTADVHMYVNYSKSIPVAARYVSFLPPLAC